MIKSRKQLELENYELKKEIKRIKAEHKKEINKVISESKQKLNQMSEKVEEIEKKTKELGKEILKKNKKFDSLLASYATLDHENTELKLNLKVVNKELKKYKKKFERECDKAKFLKEKNNKNSENSSKPPASDGLKKKVQNHREASKRTQGGQSGHKYSGIKLSDTPDTIISVSTSKKCTCGGHVKDTEKKDRRQIINLKILVEIVEYSGNVGICESCGKEILPNFPKEISSRVAYGDTFKIFSTIMSDYANVSLRKITEILSSMCKIKGPSIGSISNWKREIYNQSEPIIEQLKKCIIKRPVINNDETPCSVNGNHFNYAIGSYTKDISITEVFSNRSLKSFDKMGILPKYKGTVVSDHYKAYYSYKNVENAECNVHISRYLKAVIENTDRPAAKKFYSFLYDVKKEVEKTEENRVSDERYEEIKNTWLSILDEWDKEFEEATKGKDKKYFDDERRLKNRLSEYVDNHLLFAKESEVPFENNLAERGIRVFKSKLKSCGSFRSRQSATGYSHFQSICDTAKKNGMDIVDTLLAIKNGNKNIFKFLET